MLARKVAEKLIEAVGFKTSTVTWPLMQIANVKLDASFTA